MARLFGAEVLDNQPSEEIDRKPDHGRKGGAKSQRSGLDSEQPDTGGAAIEQQPGESAQREAMGRDLRKTRLNLGRIKERRGSWLGAEIGGIQKDQVRLAREFGAGDPEFGAEPNDGHAGYLSCLKRFRQAKAGGVIPALRISQAQPEHRGAGQSLELLAEVAHQMSSPSRLICS
jgi:hypothetical protein